MFFSLEKKGWQRHGTASERMERQRIFDKQLKGKSETTRKDMDRAERKEAFTNIDRLPYFPSIHFSIPVLLMLFPFAYPVLPLTGVFMLFPAGTPACPNPSDIPIC